MSQTAWTPVEDTSGWAPVEEAPSFANGPITPQPGESFADTMARAAQAGKTVTPEQLAASYKTGVRNLPTVAGASLLAGPAFLGAGVLGPEAASSSVGGGMLGSTLAGGAGGLGTSIINTGLHAAAGEDVFNKETAKDLAFNTAMGSLFGLGFSGLAAGTSKLLKSGILGDGMANYFAEGSGGKLIPTDQTKQIQRIHELLGVKPGDLNIGLGATTAEDAYNLPGRAVLKAGFKPQDFEGLTPFEQSEKLKPAWNKAGKTVSDIADAATKKGVTFDGAKNLTQAIGDMLDPEGSKALKLANDTAEQLGIKNWQKMTPNEAVELKQELWKRLPPRFRGTVYGALSRDLNKAVPDMIPANRDYTELRTVMDSISDAQAKYMSRASPTKFDQMLDLLRQHPALAGMTGLGGTVSGGMGLYQGGKALYDLVKGR